MEKGKSTAFDEYLASLSEEDAAVLHTYFADIAVHIALPKKQKARMLADFEDAILYLSGQGVPLSEILSRLATVNLGGFYTRPATLWYPLDSAAKIYPLSMKHNRMEVFRLCVNLKEPIVPALLQIALTFTIKRFPSFATTVKKGFFWHYLDSSKQRYAIKEESGAPCRRLSIAGTNSHPFRVEYYKNRISVEFFHILTDGTGGMQFLKALTAQYLALSGIRADGSGYYPDINGIPSAEEAVNEFTRASIREDRSGFAGTPALQMGGRLSKAKPCRILHFRMQCRELRAVAKAKGATVTEYLLSRMFVATKYATEATTGNINIQIPVNMRKFYSSGTLRNFSMYFGVSREINTVGDADALLSDMKKQMTEKGTKEKMDEMMNSSQFFVRALRFIPLVVKAPVAQCIYGFLGDKIFTNTLSNLGVVDMPKELLPHIESFDFVLGAPISNRVTTALVSCGEVSTLSITKNTKDPSFEEKLLELLVQDGISVTVQGSSVYEH